MEPVDLRRERKQRQPVEFGDFGRRHGELHVHAGRNVVTGGDLVSKIGPALKAAYVYSSYKWLPGVRDREGTRCRGASTCVGMW